MKNITHYMILFLLLIGLLIIYKRFEDQRIKEEKATLTKLKMNHSVSPIENPLKITFTRKAIARLKTELTSRKEK